MRVATAVLGLLVTASMLAQDSRASRQAAMETITAAELKKHLSVLSADEMRGRQTPSRELTAAAKYLASQFEAGGANAAAPEGGYLQKKALQVTSFDVAAARLTLTINDVQVPLTVGENIDLSIRGVGPVAIDKAPIVVVPAAALASRDEGAAQLATEVRGKLVLIVGDRLIEKKDPLESFLARAEALEAVGCVLVETGSAPIKGIREYRRARIEAQQPKRERKSTRVSIGIAIADEAIKAHLMARLEAKAGSESRPFALPDVTLSADVKVTESEAEVSNVLAMVPAAPGPRADEAVVFSAHYDHIGIAPPVEGDWVFNGADDDGSGSVSLLELAQAFATMRPPPARKVIFCAFFGEERGGLGAKYYVEHPAHPLDKTVCDLNIEMIGRSFDVGPKVAWVTGYDYSNLGEILAAGGSEIGVRIIADPYPRQNFFLRSDNVAFVRAKIPGHSISAGSTHPDYHGVDDEVDRIEFENMEQLVRAIFLGSARIADGSQNVRWTRDIPRVR